MCLGKTSDSFVTLWTVALQALPSLESSRQEYWSGLPCPPPGDRPGPGTEPTSLMSPALAGGFFTIRASGKLLCEEGTSDYSLDETEGESLACA